MTAQSPIPAGRDRASFAEAADVTRFLETLGRYERGEIDAEAWRAFRLLNGTYPQRQGGELSMLRAKFPQGVLTAAQLEAVGDVADRHARGFAHLTTRQNVQFHFVPLSQMEPALQRLAAAGITTREACGNSVRNVVGCPRAGVAADEVFDPTPYGEALTRHFLRAPLATALPRKFKIAFEGCPADHALTPIHDLGFRAAVRVRDGRTERGFAVSAAGGTATMPASGRLLAEFLPAGELLGLAEAVLVVFDRLGERKNRKAARMKFLVKKLGWEAFKAEVASAFEAVRARGVPPLPFDPGSPPAEAAPSWERPPPPAPEELAALVAATEVRGPGQRPSTAPGQASPAALAAWRLTNVRPQRQAGYVTAAVTLPLGDVTSGQLRALARLAAAHGEGAVRATLEQDLLLRWVPEGEVEALHRGLAAAGLARDGAGTVVDVVSCPGAESCRLAVTSSRGMGRVVEDFLRARPALAGGASDLSIKVSGCPNGCAQHHVAGIGLQGSARRLGDGAIPQYFVLLGGGVANGEARFGRLAAKIPARRVPAAVERLLALHRAEAAPNESATAFLARLDLARAKEALRDLTEISEASAGPDDHVEPGEEGPFKVGEGEVA